MADKKKAAEGDSVAGKKAAGKKSADKTAVQTAVVPEVLSEPKPRTQSTKIPKLSKSNKSRLPRRQKKALQKAAQTKQSGG